MRKENNRGNNPFIETALTLGLTMAVTACGGGRYERTRAITESSSAVSRSNEKTNQIQKEKNDLTEKVTELVKKWADDQKITTKVRMLSYSEGCAVYNISLEFLKTGKYVDQLYLQTDQFKIEIYPGMPNITGQVEKALKEHQTYLNTIRARLITM